MIEKINPALRNKANEYWSDFQYIFKTLYPNSEERDFAIIASILCGDDWEAFGMRQLGIHLVRRL